MRKPAVLLFRRNQLWTVVGLLALFIAAWICYERSQSAAVDSQPAKERTIHIVTGEFASKLPDGREIESYRWDPGTVYVRKGETVKLNLYGVNGASHPFIIEGTDIKGEVKKGEETVIRFRGDKEGIYRIICIAHPDAARSGPMIGYIVVH